MSSRKGGGKSYYCISNICLSICSCAGMFHYGMLIANTTIFLTNGIGALLQCAYILLYMLITPDLVCLLE